MPLGKDRRFRSTAFSLSASNDYSEPLFDNNKPNKIFDSNDYALPHDDTLVVADNQANVGGSSHIDRRTESFVQPAASMKLLVAQIKDTMVKKILSESIWYDINVYVLYYVLV